jgi:dnd system-associated protein 4
MSVVSPSVRRSPRHEKVLQSLVQKDGMFETMRDALVFAAAVGYCHGSRDSFEGNEGSIDWSTMAVNPFFERLVLMLSAAEGPDNPERISRDNIRDLVRVFEEYAAGGLGVVENLAIEEHCLTVEVIPRLIAKRLAEIDDKAG